MLDFRYLQLEGEMESVFQYREKTETGWGEWKTVRAELTTEPLPHPYSIEAPA